MDGNPFGAFREECLSILRDALGEEGVAITEGEIKLTVPPDPSHGNLSFSTHTTARRAGVEPRALADRIVERAKDAQKRLVAKVEGAGGGYVNFFINETEFAELTLNSITSMGKDYGSSKGNGEKVIVEHTSVNPIHPIHIGGARNAVIGDCLSRILKAAGNDVRRHFYIDDVGLQVAQASYGFGKIGGVAREGKSDHLIGFIYATTSCAMNIKALRAEIERLKSKGKDEDARQKIMELDDWVGAASDLRAKNEKMFDAISGSIMSTEDPEAEVAGLLRRYEERHKEAVRLIRGLSELALAGFKETLRRVDIEFDSWDWESELASWSGEADKVVERLSRTDFVKVEEGTVILDAELTAKRFNLKERYGIKTEVPPLTLKRSDGTTLYTTRDIAYTLWKFERADRVINVISIEQRLPQLQLKLALYALGEGEMAERLTHFSYELVHLPGYKMSGRRGRYVTFDDVIDEAVERAYREVSVRSPHLSEEERKGISELVGVGSVRYALIAVASNKPITFTWERVLNFEQNSAPFIQYSHARASNILLKAEGGWREGGTPDYGSLNTKYEHDLIVRLGSFPETVEEAARTLRPEMIAEYTNDMVSKFNLFYDNVPVLKTKEGGARRARLRLVEATKTVLANALWLIGIEAPARM
ncbi:MAG: arginine--tRNA ligase [Candidatus Verstraetearchaeota archaeon]|nr:arginine--tRNA ligase [Candidatus Verstraetearchaeota archaeon]